MEFSPFNPTVKLCLQGMELEAQNNREKALQIYLEGWNEANNDFEKYLTSYYIAKLQDDTQQKIFWLESTLSFALKSNSPAVNTALPTIYLTISECYKSFGEFEKAEELLAQSEAHRYSPSDKGPFYHGTKADLSVGDFLVAGGKSNYQNNLKMNHIYFTALVDGAGLAAALANGEGTERVYVVETTGSYENDPNLTDKKFPGNPTRSYRSEAPLKIVGEIKEWARRSPEEIQKFKEKLDNNKGEIIN